MFKKKKRGTAETAFPPKVPRTTFQRLKASLGPLLSQFPSRSKICEKTHQSCAFFSVKNRLVCSCRLSALQAPPLNFLCFWKVPSHKQRGEGTLRQGSSGDSPGGTAQWGTIYLFKDVCLGFSFIGPLSCVSQPAFFVFTCSHSWQDFKKKKK